MKIIQLDSHRLVFAPPKPSQRTFAALSMLLVAAFGIAIIVLAFQVHLNLAPAGPGASGWFSTLFVSLIGVGCIGCAWRMRTGALPYRLVVTRQPPTAAYCWGKSETQHRTFAQPTAIVVMPAHASRGWPVGFLLEHGDRQQTLLLTSHEKWATEKEALAAATPVAVALAGFFECKLEYTFWSPSLVPAQEV
jgi:hypothetical protein